MSTTVTGHIAVANGGHHLMDNPNVSVVLTVFKRIDYLAAAIKSVLIQTFVDFEIIVADDSDSLEIKSICDSFNDSRIRYRSNKCNLGVALNVKLAVQEARGQFISILNDDDEYEAEFLEKLVQHFEKDGEIIACFCDHYIMDREGLVNIIETENNTKRWGRQNLSEGLVSDIQLLELNFQVIPISIGTVFRKAAINLDQLYSEVAGAYDLWIAYLLVNQGKQIYYIPQRLTRYRSHPEMETVRRSIEKNFNKIFLYTRALQLHFFAGQEYSLYRKLSTSYFSVGKDHLWFNRCRLARSYFITSLAISFNIRSVAGLLLALLPKGLRVRLKFTLSVEPNYRSED